MMRPASKLGLRVAPGWLLAILLLALSTFGNAVNAELGPVANPVGHTEMSAQPSLRLVATDGGSDQPLEAAETQQSGWQRIPAWLQILITVGIALLIWYIIMAIAQSRRKDTEEIVHYKDMSGSTGYGSARPRVPQPTPERQPAPQEYRVPIPERPEGQNRREPVKKNNSWPFAIAIIVILSIVRQCFGAID